MHIAVVDDDQDLCTLLQDLFGEEGFEVKAFDSLRTLLVAIYALPSPQSKPQVAIVDFTKSNFPTAKNVDEFLGLCSELNRLGVDVVICTAWAIPHLPKIAEERGFEFLSKPFELDEMFQKVLIFLGAKVTTGSSVLDK